jgi:hypothetical protein
MSDIQSAFTQKLKDLYNYTLKVWYIVRNKALYSFARKQRFYNNLIIYYNAQKDVLEAERETLLKIAASEVNNKRSTKKACLIGINYSGTESELKGCINDVHMLKDMLISKYNYNREDITLLTDQQATRQNILKEFTSLVKNAVSGDTVFFSFSGHGSYVKDINYDEIDGEDELIVGVDYFGITDDELKNILDTHLKANVNMFALFDSCHSGTILDLKYSFENSINRVVNENYKETKGNVILLSGCRDNQVSIDAYINGSFNGALSWVFVDTVKNNPLMTWGELMKKIGEVLSLNGMTQIPQLSCGTNLDLINVNVNV